MAIFGPKKWVNPLEKCQFFEFLNFFFLQPRQAFFRSRIPQNTFFQSILCKKKKVGKMANFGRKPWVNPFGKMSIFRLFELLFFIAYTGVFSFQIIIQYIFLVYITEKKIFEKRPFLDQNHGLTTLEKSQFLYFLNFLFVQPGKAF